MKAARGVFLKPALLNSKHFNDLNASELKILIGFLSRIRKGLDGKRWKALNSEKLIYTYTEIQNDFDYTERTIARAIKNLIAYGYIKQIRRGSSDGHNRIPSVYEVPRPFWPV